MINGYSIKVSIESIHVHFMALSLGVILIGHKYCVKHLNERI